MRRTTRFTQSIFLAGVIAASVPAMAQQTRKVPPEQLPNFWILLNRGSISVDVPNSGVNIYKPGCVAVTYTIGSDGAPMNLQAAKIVPASDLGKAALSAVSKFRYGPSLTNKDEHPVATYYVVPFNSPDDNSQAALMAPCQLPGYAG